MKKLGIIVLLALVGVATPLLLQAQTTETYAFSTNRLVPDGNAAGLSDARTLGSAIASITSVTAHLKITGEFNGDLYGYLKHASGFAILLNRPGKTAANAAGYADSGLDVTFQTGAANGDIHVYQLATNPAAGSPLGGAWEPDGRNVDPTNATEASARSTSLTNFNGLNAGGGWTLYLADLESGGTNQLTEWSLTIVGRAYPSVAWANPADLVYGTALGPSQMNAAATYNSTNVPGTFTYTPAAGTVLNAGPGHTLSVTFTPTDTTTFLPVSTNITLNVTAAPLTITAGAQSKTYGQTVVFGGGSALFTSIGLQNSETIGSVTLTVNNNGGAAGAPVSGSPYTITPSAAAGGTFTPANYNITYNPGALTVNPATVTVASGLTANPKIYDGTTGATMTSNNVSLSGVLAGDGPHVALSTNGYLAAFAGKNAANGIAVAVSGLTLTGSAANNYTLTQPGSAANITPKPLTVTGLSVPPSKVYDGTTATAAPSGTAALLTAETAAFGTGGDGKPYIGDAVAIIGTAAGSYNSPNVAAASTVTFNGLATANGNYSITPPTQAATITKAATAGLAASSPNPALPGASVTFTMTVSPVAPGAGAPGGTMQFRIDGTIAGAGALSGGVAAFATAALAHGSHAVAAEYAGDPNFAGVTNSAAPAQVINTPPVAGSVTIQRYQAQGVKVSLSNILANCADADGDTLNLTVSSTSASNATITVTNGWVFYTPAQGFTNADAFTYTVTDGYGGSAMGTVTVAIEADNSQGQNLTITDLGNGSFQIDGNGIPGRIYRLQSSPTIGPPAWQDIPGGNVTPDGTGAFQYTDTSGVGTRFYRTVYP